MKKTLALLALILAPILASADEVKTTKLEELTSTEKKLDPKTDFEFTYYWGDWCSHCAKVNAYFGQNDILKKYNIKKKEVYNDRNNSMEFWAVLEALNVESGGVPFMVILDKTKEIWDESRFSYISWDAPVISMFKDFEKGNNDVLTPEDDNSNLGNDISTEKETENNSNNSAALLLILGLLILTGFGVLIFYKGK